MIAAAICRGALYRVDVLRFGDDAEQRAVAPLVRAEQARIVLGKRKTDRTQLDAILNREDRFGEQLCFRTRTVEQVKY